MLLQRALSAAGLHVQRCATAAAPRLVHACKAGPSSPRQLSLAGAVPHFRGEENNNNKGAPSGALGVHDYGGTAADAQLLRMDLTEREYTPLERKVGRWAQRERG